MAHPLSTALIEHQAHLSDLYTQLDAEASSGIVCRKLEELHAALVDTVARQRREAEDEVKQVKEECIALQAELDRLARVLGKRLAGDSESDVSHSNRHALPSLTMLTTP